ncbi:hypothetical protein EWM64_g1377 [Hericium alpestre]|uniref:Uncharacterized protein n=1 Tax=Hericium alpestre TaxID=135208 RepID=A0A4Z0A9N0_9AGAM|nr:hypothetical protein EWM64_g1377 [Hericium alpestre]
MEAEDVRITVSADWLALDEEDNDRTGKDTMRVPKTRSLGSYLSDANEAWYRCYGIAPKFVAGEEAAKYKRRISVREAFKDKSKDGPTGAHGARAVIRDILAQLQREKPEDETLVERLVGRLLLPFYKTPACQLLCHAELGAPSPFGTWGHGKPDIASQVDT